MFVCPTFRKHVLIFSNLINQGEQTKLYNCCSIPRFKAFIIRKFIIVLLLQITLAGEPLEQPKWNQMFFFHGDERSLFSRFSTLVIEYFSASQGNEYVAFTSVCVSLERQHCMVSFLLAKKRLLPKLSMTNHAQV